MICFLFMAILLFAQNVMAQPSISSTSGGWSHGASVTISGTGFGTKTTAAPLLYDDFEGGSNGSNIKPNNPVVGTAWDDFVGGGTQVPRYSNAISRGVSAISSLHDFETDGTYNSSLEYFNSTATTVYFTFWWRHEKTSVNWRRQNKPWIQYGSNGTYPEMYTGFGSPSDTDGGIRNSIQDDPAPGNATLYGSTNISDIDGTWVRLEVYLVQSDVDVANGTFCYWTYRSYLGTPSFVEEACSTTQKMRTQDRTWNQWHFGSYFTNDDPAGAKGRVYVDDIYFDNTRARVEICSASTWAARTHCEIQRPTAWSDTEVTIVTNQGDLGALDGGGRYIYVVDSSGGVNSDGFLIAAGGAVTVIGYGD